MVQSRFLIQVRFLLKAYFCSVSIRLSERLTLNYFHDLHCSSCGTSRVNLTFCTRVVKIVRNFCLSYLSLARRRLMCWRLCVHSSRPGGLQTPPRPQSHWAPSRVASCGTEIRPRTSSRPQTVAGGSARPRPYDISPGEARQPGDRNRRTARRWKWWSASGTR